MLTDRDGAERWTYSAPFEVWTGDVGWEFSAFDSRFSNLECAAFTAAQRGGHVIGTWNMNSGTPLVVPHDECVQIWNGRLARWRGKLAAKGAK